MKRLILTATVLVFFAGVSYLAPDTRAAGKEKEDETAHRVGLIDLGYVFENYDKLKVNLEDWNTEVQQEQNNLKHQAQKFQSMVEEMRTFAEGSPERTSRETKLTKMQVELESQKKQMDVKLGRERAKILHTAYLEVQDAVKQFCDRFGFTVVIRFTRVDANSNDPQKIQAMMGQSVVYHRKRDDLTDGVLKYLNDRYQQSAGDTARPVTDKPERSDKPSKTAKSARKSNVQPAGGIQD